MSISPQGELQWKVPIDFEQDSVRILIRAMSGDSEAFAQFELSVQDPPATPKPEKSEPAKD
jgi:hypothetical protein